MVQYAVKIGQTIFTELTDVQASTTINPFGDRYICEFRDNEGNQFDEVSYTDPVEIFARDPTAGGGSIFTNLNKTRSYNNISYNQTTLSNDFNSIFEGYVVESDGGEEGSRDVLTVTVYSFDQIIRNERVSNDQSGDTIATALEDIIKTDTPVEYVGGNVSVGDNRTLNRPLQGLTVEEALRVLSLRSENENYGVNDSREFFFRQRVESSGEKDITDSDVTNYSVPERGKESKNEVTVNYNNNDDRVTVSNGSNQLNVQDSLGTQDPVNFPDEISRPSITDRQEALAEGREFLRQRENTLAGRVTVVGDTDFLSNDVGDTVNVTITPRGIDDEFVLVGKEVDYIRNEISFDIIQKRGDQDSLLKAIGQQLKREELSGTDQGTPSDKVTQTNVRVDIEQTYNGVTAQNKRVTTVCRNKLRTSWLDDSPKIATILIIGGGIGGGEGLRLLFGTKGEVRRSTQSLDTVVDTNLKGVYEPTSDTFKIDFNFVGTGNVIAVEDDDGDFLFVAKIDEVTDPTGSIEATIKDGNTDKSVLTNTGQTAVRNIFSQLNPNGLPTKVKYGNDGSEPQESDIDINSQIERQYADKLISGIDTTTEWQNNTSISSTKRAYIDSGKVKLAQSAFVREAENVGQAGGQGVISRSDYSDNQGYGVREPPQGTIVAEYNFTTEYDINNPVYAVRLQETDTTNVATNVLLDGSNEGQLTITSTVEWDTVSLSSINAGSHTLKLEVDFVPSGDAEYQMDVMAVYDSDLISQPFDNTDLSTVSRDYLNDPQLYPSSESVDIDTVNLVQQVDSAELQTTYNDISNGQFIEIGNGTTNTANNSQSVTETFASPSNTINATLGLDGYGTGGSQTPRERFNGQEVDIADILADLAVLNKSDVGRADYEVIFGGSDVNGLTLKEAGQVNSNGDALTRSIFPEIEPSGESVIFSEDLGFDIS